MMSILLQVSSLLMLCICGTVTSLQACGNELTAVLMQRCTELKKRDHYRDELYKRQSWKPEGTVFNNDYRNIEREELIRG